MSDDFSGADLERQLFYLKEFYRTEKLVLDIRNAYPGMVLKESIFIDGQLILAEGKVLTATMIATLQRKGIREIVIDPKDDVLASLDGIVNATVDTPAMNEMKNFLRSTQTLDDSTIKTLVASVKKLVHKILDAEHFTYTMSEYLEDIERDLASHAVRTCVYSLVLAKAYNMKTQGTELNYDDIAIAAMFHDIGSSCVSREVRSQIHFLGGFKKINPFLTDENIIRIIKKYDSRYDTYYAYCILKAQPSISATARSMVFFSRENQKGTGPYQDTKLSNGMDNISALSPAMIGAEIINICSTFDKEVCNCLDRNGTLENVQVFIHALGQTKTFNQELLDMLVENIPLYPIGTRIKLGDSANSYGIVVQNFNTLQYYHLPQVLKLPEREIMDLRYSITPIISEVCRRESRINELDMMRETLNEESALKR